MFVCALAPTRAAIAVVIAGLDPAIHPVRKKVLTKRMDPRVKPAGDGRLHGARLPLTRLAPIARRRRARTRLWALATLSPQRRGEGADRVSRSFSCIFTRIGLIARPSARARRRRRRGAGA